jgi:hypothetical protein
MNRRVIKVIMCVLCSLTVVLLPTGIASATGLIQLPIWSGYLEVNAHAANVRGVSGSWLVPKAACTSSFSRVFVWVGIGGYVPNKPETLFQTGTQINCVNGNPQYLAFQEHNSPALPSTAVVLNCAPRPFCGGGPASVQAGDSMTASVLATTNKVIWSLSDRRGAKDLWHRSSSWPVASPPRHSAECIVEDPIDAVSGTKNGQIALLTDFGHVTFASCNSQSQNGSFHSVLAKSLPKGSVLQRAEIWQGGRALAIPSIQRLLVTQPTLPVLGQPGVGAVVGFGQIEPSFVSFGGDPESMVNDVAWGSWGGSQAFGVGTAIYVANNQIVSEGTPQPASVEAFDLGSCKGKLTYEGVTWYFPQHGQSFDSSFSENLCTHVVPTQAPAPTTTMTTYVPVTPTPTSPPSPANSAAPCTESAIAVGVAQVPDPPVIDVSSFACSGNFAYAFVDVGSNGNRYSVTDVLQASNSAWLPADRGAVCANESIPPDIYNDACNTN